MSAPLGRNERLLSERLAGLSQRERVKFSAACAQRLVTAIDQVPRLEEPHDELVKALNSLFEHVESGDLADLPQTGIDGADSYVVDEDDPAWVPSDAILENAVAAVAYSYDSARSDEVVAAVWAARQLDESADFVDETIANGPLAPRPWVDEGAGTHMDRQNPRISRRPVRTRHSDYFDCRRIATP